MKPYVDILGTRYTIEVHKVSEDKYMQDHNLDGYCNSCLHQIVIADLKELYNEWTDEERAVYLKQLLRHEVLHGFLNSAGLQDCAHQSSEAWSKNEEMIDWFAIQFPKLLEAYKWLECI
jgi:hypothetical protein